MDTIWALILPGAVPIFNVILLMNFFKAIPHSLEEAAIIDGANPIQILLKVFLPMSKAALATIVLFCVVNHWNAFFDGIYKFLGKVTITDLYTIFGSGFKSGTDGIYDRGTVKRADENVKFDI